MTQEEWLASIQGESFIDVSGIRWGEFQVVGEFEAIPDFIMEVADDA
jgi:hypothetical protein